MDDVLWNGLGRPSLAEINAMAGQKDPAKAGRRCELEVAKVIRDNTGAVQAFSIGPCNKPAGNSNGYCDGHWSRENRQDMKKLVKAVDLIAEQLGIPVVEDHT